MKIEKEKAIKKEIERLSGIFKEIDENKQKLANGLIQEAAFMRVTLNELKQDVNEKGILDEMCQGSYSIMRESPALKSYNTLIQRYTTVCKELNSLLPKEMPKIENDDGFEAFMLSR